MAEEKARTINISLSSAVKILLVILLFVLLYLIRDVIAIFIFALIVASAITPAVNLLEKIKIPRIFGALIVYILTIGILALLISLIVPTVARDLKVLSSNLPGYIDNLSKEFHAIQESSSRFQIVINQLQKYLSGIGDFLKQTTTNLFSTAVSVFGGVFSFILSLVISFYLSVQKKGVQRVLVAITPFNHRDYLLDLWERAQRKLGRWLQGQLFLGIIVGVLVYIGLYFLQIKFALLLAVLAGVLEVFPYIGPVIAAVPAVILGFLQAPILGLWTIVLYLVVQQLENYLIVPFVIGKVVKLNPVVVIMALLIGGKVGGIVGMILSVPITAVIAEFARDMVSRRKQAS